MVGEAEGQLEGALGDALANLCKTRLKPLGGSSIRVRADTFGYVQRCWPEPSPIDALEARRAGRHAAALAMAGRQGLSVTVNRPGSGIDGEPYASDYGAVELAAVAGKTRTMPPEFIDGHNDVSRAFIDYCCPLIGEMPPFERL